MDEHALIGAVAEMQAQERARRRLIDFCGRVTPTFQVPKHIAYLAEKLELAESGACPRLALSCAPGHGKSTLLQHFVGWFLGRDPTRRILAISANEALAKRNSRDTQSLVRSDKWPWGEVRLASDSVLEWSTLQGGEVRAIGKGGTVTGFRAEMILVDDLQADAGSPTTQESDEQWFRQVLSTRLEPNGVVVIIQTRWADGDIIGRLLTGESADQWVYVNLPVFAGPNDALGREEGRELWPARWPRELLEKKRVEVGSAAFSAQYLGDPVPESGGTYKREWFEHRYSELPRVPTRAETSRIAEWASVLGYSPEERYGRAPLTVTAVDCAMKTSIASDYSAIVSIATDWRDYFVASVVRERLEFHDLLRRIIEEYHKNGSSYLFVEEAASGAPIVQEIRRQTSLPVIGVPPKGSKCARADANVPVFEAGRVKLPHAAPWLDTFIAECLRFPHGRNDDQVDALNLALSKLRELVGRAIAVDRGKGDILLTRLSSYAGSR